MKPSNRAVSFMQKKATTSWWKRGLQEETVWRISIEKLTTRGTIVIIATEK
ncbi:hypothetical protein [Pelosinus fermentans]|nr:hypothetical protein [Pelosinus fermentans]MCC5465137.1 hypothetical protein [Pelosinus baikalensis]MCC5465248.1 hypothetical protein [Pelosinus baikalensis]